MNQVIQLSRTYDEYRREKPSKADYRRKNPLKVFDYQKLATDVIWVSFDVQ